MAVFGAYSAYYDLLYADKDYEGEAAFVLQALRVASRKIETVLELGCGTGKHAMLLAQAGLQVHGVDLSQDMLSEAERRKSKLDTALASRISFAYGDVRTYVDTSSYDAVISLFHVISYQQTNADLLAMFATAAKRLNPQGVFFFDFWYGPAVLTLRPAVAAKSMENDNFSVLRVARPQLYNDRSIVDVNYQIVVRDKSSGLSEEISETHHMRYLFLTEIEFLASQVGLKLLKACAWMSDVPASEETWGVCATLIKEDI